MIEQPTAAAYDELVEKINLIRRGVGRVEETTPGILSLLGIERPTESPGERAWNEYLTRCPKDVCVAKVNALVSDARRDERRRCLEAADSAMAEIGWIKSARGEKHNTVRDITTDAIDALPEL